MKKLISLLGPFKALFFLALISLTLSSMFNAALTGLVQPLLDNVLTDQVSSVDSKAEQLFGFSDKMKGIVDWFEKKGIDLNRIGQETREAMPTSPIAWAVLALVIFLFEALFDFIGTYTMGRVGIAVVVRMRQDLMDKVMSLSLRFFKSFSTGEILTRVNTDVLRVQNAISIKLGEIAKESTKTIVYLFLAFYLNWKLSLTLFGLVPLVGIPVVIFTKKIRKYAVKSQVYLGHLTSHLKEVLVGIRIVKGFQREAFESKKLEQKNRFFFKYALRELKVVALTTPVMSLIGMVIILSFVSYGSVGIQSGAISKGHFIFYVLVIYQLYQPIKRIARANSEIQQAVGVLPRLQEVLHWDNEIVETKTPQRFPGFPEIETIRFEDVCFRYEPQSATNVLDHINLTVEKGNILALVGASGSGKSTLVNMLPRFYDITSGTITMNGTDVRQMSKTDLRSLISIVTQDTILFDDSVHNNIAYGMEDVSRERVIFAAKQAFADPFIEQLPEGYDTHIGESGGTLSGGQRQRLSIARAFLRESPILILDEATSALDTESEREVQMALDNLMQSRTTIVIAHRLSTIRQAHVIVVMHEGRIVERGDHSSLMAKKGMYRKLVQMQEEGIRAL